MIEFIIWLIGTILVIKAIIEIFNMKGDTVKKLLFVILLLLTSWLGLAFYYFYAKDKMPQWL